MIQCINCDNKMNTIVEISNALRRTHITLFSSFYLSLEHGLILLWLFVSYYKFSGLSKSRFYKVIVVSFGILI